ncbi:MAG TPA: hypothetical protein PK773_07550, partial [Aminivibrio sp.]|nr:hypothetical protein [Aminivibrio sp.]
NMAMVLSQLDRLEEAESHLRETERLDPAYGGRVNYALAEIRARQSRKEEAMDYLEKALDRGFRDKTQLEKNETFRELREMERFRLLLRGER